MPSEPQESGTEQSGPSEGPDPWCTWCHFEPPDGELPYRIKGEDDGRWPPAFCSLQCAARWGNAAHQDRIYHVEHGRGIRADGGEPATGSEHESVDEMTLDELREEFVEVRDAMDPWAAYGDQPDLVDRRAELWREIRDRSDVEPPKCKECGGRKWSQAPGEPARCDRCGYSAASVESAVHDAWDRMLGGATADE